jgi:hypothetical protein
VAKTDILLGTSAVRSTYIIEPARLARRCRTASSSVVSWKPLPTTEGDCGDGEERRGFNARTSFRCEFSEMPASVSSVNAPPNRSKPCLKMTKETSSPGEGYKQSRAKELHSKNYSPPIGSKGNAGNSHDPIIAKRATTLEYASLR